ncbi:hypothetical protein QQ045_025381 [Rhodiola kirilowii]
MDIASLEKFLQERIKVGGKPGALGDAITVTREIAWKFTMHLGLFHLGSKEIKLMLSRWFFDFRYLKYLIKKYLKKHNVRDWLRVIASNKDHNVYELRYFNIAENEGEDDE